ncbi:ABC transporter substrate-binding protein [Lacisediminimonas sp.]|uniref:ABC transporter substrate-binding protein n=1 Tax=Lacisediminimonas sp. TaxID=3060582 RepID=UPI0027198DC9|nr:ABC transporter substrate-binding protein [Lacisediminimonas sp.]MDO8299464.1 ABC transporter substrate-binding protein [Lacisediminimonas sp.]
MNKQMEAADSSFALARPCQDRIRRVFFGGCLLFGLALSWFAGDAQAANWKIGELNSYADFPEFADDYRRGWQLAVAQVNAAGGVAQRPLQVISVDDGAARNNASRRAQELIVNHEVDLLAGTYLSNVGLAVSSIAAKNKKVFIAAGPQSDTLTWDRGNRYTFRLRPSTYMQAAMLVEQAAAMPARRWAIVAPNYEYGQSAVANFRTLLKARRPDVEFVDEQWPALGKLDAPAVVAALARAKPDAVFNACFGPDLDRLLEQSRHTRVFEQARLVSMAGAGPAVIKALQGTALAGWMVAGSPPAGTDIPGYAPFRQAFFDKYRVEPQLPALIGYTMIQAIAQALRNAGSADSEALIQALRGMEFESPVGKIQIRAIDHQATMGAFIGHLVARGPGVQWRYLDGAKYLPGEDFVRANRPASAMR